LRACCASLTKPLAATSFGTFAREQENGFVALRIVS
jgi:hypothetical protein